MKKIITETNDIIKKLILGQTITIKFHYLTELKEVTGMIIKIDKVEKNLYLPNCCIPFANIITIKTWKRSQIMLHLNHKGDTLID